MTLLFLLSCWLHVVESLTFNVELASLVFRVVITTALIRGGRPSLFESFHFNFEVVETYNGLLIGPVELICIEELSPIIDFLTTHKHCICGFVWNPNILTEFPMLVIILIIHIIVIQIINIFPILIVIDVLTDKRRLSLVNHQLRRVTAV